MAVSSTQITVNATGATALVAAAVTGASQVFSVTSSAGVRNVWVQVGATGPVYLGGSVSIGPTGAAGGLVVGPTATFGPIPLQPSEALYGLGSASSTVSVLVTGT